MKYTTKQLNALPWWKIRGKIMSHAAYPYRIKQVSLADGETYSNAYVMQDRNDITDRQVVSDPARMDQIWHNGF